MSATLLIARRELVSLLSAPQSFLMAALVVLLDGLLFNAFAIGPDPRTSARVLEDLLQIESGTTMVLSIFVAMRSIVEERDRGSLTLLLSSPARDSSIVLGKFLGAFSFVMVTLLLTLHLPVLVVVRGSISWAHLGVGYLGLVLLAGASLSLGLVGSSFAQSQLGAGLLSFGLLVLLLVGWLLARISDPPVSDLLSYLALWETHFRPFQRGILGVSHVVYFVSLTTISLLVAMRALGASRWD